MKMMLILKMMQRNSLLLHFQKIIYNVNSIFFLRTTSIRIFKLFHRRRSTIRRNMYPIYLHSGSI